MKQTLSWGVVGTGGIAADFAAALTRSRRCRIVNVAGRTPERARAFADRWRIPRAAASLDDLLADREVEAVYIATPHPFHEETALAAIAAGKAVLCEKPLALDAASSARVIDAARKRGVFLMEGYMYRGHPLMRDVVERLQAGVIGRIRHVRADFAFRVPRDPHGRLFATGLGGGGILDVGGYVVSFARLVAGLAEGQRFAEPIAVAANGVIGPHGADETATALLTFASRVTATVTAAVFHDAGTCAVVFGDAGKLVLPDPWIPQGHRQCLETSYVIHRDGQPPETVRIATEMATYAIEAELVADTLPAVEPAWPAMTWADTLGNMRVLDAWRAAVLTARAG
ncbi:MAG TPA: Gfo/Idh/MocA family oxidoreductase [Polyangia bacterium]|nr:Gfo/Idh/MocA family oxidoreductase [Polyangia bacterium]